MNYEKVENQQDINKNTDQNQQTEGTKSELSRKAETQGNENNQQGEQKKEGANFSMNLALLGGVVGAGIGLLANPKTSKKVMKNLGESEFLKIAGEEFRKTAQELLAGQAQNSVKQLASGYLSKIEENLLSPKKGKGSNESSQVGQKYEEIKEENKNLNGRLERIEKMLSDLAGSK
ncbi:YtxH domain-containing protein [Peribacillus kribbensis]|uniref:YtxH domain-containing protein n=1 Tax=Peribacillus kribbensis TaxID=356658 RepID=UPI000423CA4A|nr:YtxH domain-containing protein [Peribacillus kribbensis]